MSEWRRVETHLARDPDTGREMHIVQSVDAEGASLIWGDHGTLAAAMQDARSLAFDLGATYTPPIAALP